LKITESKLRRIIREAISAMPSQIPAQDSNYPQEEEDDYGTEEAIEEPNIKEKHFGFNLDAIGEKITKAFELWHPRNPEIYNKGPLSRFIVEKVNDPEFKFLGEGSFRMAFSYGDDYVVKVAAPGYYFKQALKMNKEDAMLGRMPKYSYLFPKVYEADTAYKWIIMEKCSVINNEKEFVKFFPNPDVDPSVPGLLTRMSLFTYVLSYCVYREIGNTRDMEGAASYLDYLIKHELEVNFEQLIGSYEKLTLFNKIVDFCAEFGVMPREIRVGNAGISSDGRFVIIDSSVGETINQNPT